MTESLISPVLVPHILGRGGMPWLNDIYIP
jgi:hypothetical protein